MTTRRSPDGQVYTEVPVVPRHDQLDGRSLGNSHPIEAITGLQDALDGKVDAVEGKGLSTEDFTTSEKEKLASYEPSPIKLIKVDGVTQEIDAEGAVDLTMYWEQMGRYITWDDATGKLALKNDWQMPLSLTTLPRDGVTAAAYDQATGRLVLTLHDGSTVYADLSPLEQEYTAGNGLRLTGRAFALADTVATAVSEASDHVATDSVHVSAADRAKWNGVDGAVKTTGDQSIAGAKTFTGAVVVPTPQAASQAATKAYVDAVAGGGGGSGPWTTLSSWTSTDFDLLFDTDATTGAITAKKDVMVYTRAYPTTGSVSGNGYVDSAFIPKGGTFQNKGHMELNFVHSSVSSGNITVTFICVSIPKAFSGITGAGISPMGQSVLKASSVTTSDTTTSATLTPSATPYDDTGATKGVINICFQYRD